MKSPLSFLVSTVQTFDKYALGVTSSDQAAVTNTGCFASCPTHICGPLTFPACANPNSTLVECTFMVWHGKEILHLETSHSPTDLGEAAIWAITRKHRLSNDTTSPTLSLLEQLVQQSRAGAVRSDCDTKQYHNPMSHKSWFCQWIPYPFPQALSVESSKNGENTGF